MLVSNALLVVYLAHQARFWSSRHVKKNRSSQFFDLGIENTLVRGTLAKFWTSLYVAYGSLTVYVRYHARCNIQFFVWCMYDRATYGLKKRPTDKYFRKMGFHKRYLLSPPLGAQKRLFDLFEFFYRGYFIQTRSAAWVPSLSYYFMYLRERISNAHGNQVRIWAEFGDKTISPAASFVLGIQFENSYFFDTRCPFCEGLDRIFRQIVDDWT
jgi:hypothetical protein